MTFSEYRNIPLNYQPAQVARLNKAIDDMNFNELREFIKFQARQGKNINEELVSLHQRISIPFANFIFALLAAVLGFIPNVPVVRQREWGSVL